MTINHTETEEGTNRALLDRLLDRWQEVADAYKPGDLPWDDIDRKYRDQRLIYLRNIRDLRHVLDTGQIPCGLMNDEERRRGDCGQVHEDEHDKYGSAAPDIDPLTWPEMSPAERRLAAMDQIIVGHLAEALIDSKGEELRAWARSLAHELRRSGIDLRDAIGARLTEIALGRLDEEHPF